MRWVRTQLCIGLGLAACEPLPCADGPTESCCRGLAEDFDPAAFEVRDATGETLEDGGALRLSPAPQGGALVTVQLEPDPEHFYVESGLALEQSIRVSVSLETLQPARPSWEAIPSASHDDVHIWFEEESPVAMGEQRMESMVVELLDACNPNHGRGPSLLGEGEAEPGAGWGRRVWSVWIEGAQP